ncbi:hypothetical protein GGF46_003592 [Coemansia sp. RSA 552]|nr:hypothetical protein GGF46_003592 [Coemansia sp. RSA 552]
MTRTVLDLPPPRLGLGCGVFSGAYGPVGQEQATEAVCSAFESGITLVDTSPYYGDSEVKLGEALRELQPKYPRGSYEICTKLGRYGYSRKDFDYSADRVVSSVHKSMQRLQTTYLDMVLCHDVEFVDISDVVDKALPKLFELKRQGVVRQVGVSGYPLDVLLRIAQIQYERGCPLDVCLSYCTFNLHCQLLPRYVPLLRGAGIRTIVAASPLSMGLLHQDATPNWHPAKAELKAAIAQCIEILRSQPQPLDGTHGTGITLASMAESYAFSYTGVDVHLVGAQSRSEVECAVDAYQRAQTLQLASGGKYPDEAAQGMYERVQSILRPFAEYTWESPPADA